jgi:hypothetical protein
MKFNKYKDKLEILDKDVKKNFLIIDDQITRLNSRMEEHNKKILNLVFLVQENLNINKYKNISSNVKVGDELFVYETQENTMNFINLILLFSNHQIFLNLLKRYAGEPVQGLY